MFKLLIFKDRWRFWKFVEYIGIMHVYIEFYHERIKMINNAPISKFEMANHSHIMSNHS